VSGYLFLQHRSAKLLGVPHVAMFDQLSVMSLLGVAGILELVGGALLVGFVRPACGVRAIGRGGGRLLHVTRQSGQRAYPDAQPRRGRGAVLLHFSLSCRRRCRRLEPWCHG